MTLLRAVTGESGVLVNPAGDGFDSTANQTTLACDGAHAIRGAFGFGGVSLANEAGVIDRDSGGTAFGLSEFWLSVYLRVSASDGGAAPRVIRPRNATGGGTLCGIALIDTATSFFVRIQDGTSTLADSAELAYGADYRVVLRYRAGSGANGVVEGWLATGDGATALLGSTALSTQTGLAGRVDCGDTNGTAWAGWALSLDEIKIDSAADPGPSVSTTPVNLTLAASGGGVTAAALRVGVRLPALATTGAGAASAAFATAVALALNAAGGGSASASLTTGTATTPVDLAAQAVGSGGASAGLLTGVALPGAVAAGASNAAIGLTIGLRLASLTATGAGMASAVLALPTPLAVPGTAALTLAARDGATLTLTPLATADLTLTERDGATLTLTR